MSILDRTTEPKESVGSDVVRLHASNEAKDIVRFRRSPHIVCYWRGSAFLLHHFASGTILTAEPPVVEILSGLSDWTPLHLLAESLRHFTPSALHGTLDQLVKLGVVQRSDGPSPCDKLMDMWEQWNPAAGFFHSSTKNRDGDVPVENRVHEQRLREKALVSPMPSAVKRYPAATTRQLPKFRTDSELASVLLERRTWRRFSEEPVSLDQVSTLLGLTWGVQHWANVRGQGKVVLKTSPSGGARHPIEVYLVAVNVADLAPAVYHYAADAHALECLRQPATATDIAGYLPGQPWFTGASAIFCMTAVFERERWRYSSPRTYRTILVDAGHLCQTFCLLATNAGLAPFCTMAQGDEHIERDLGLDGVSESALYVAGVGSRLPAEELEFGPGQLPEWHQ